MSKRHKDALFIQLGAVNPSGIAHSIIAACAEIREEPGFRGTAQICNDPAVRLMVHQLAFLCNARGIDDGTSTYSHLMAECKAKSEEPVNG